MATKEKFDFGKAFSELEEITKWFEEGDVDLDAGLKKFERGLELAKELKSRLREVENKVEEIKDKFADVVEEEELEEDVEDEFGDSEGLA